MSADYWNRFTQAEKLEVLENDQDTYLRRAQNALDLEAAGRFKERQRTSLTGHAADPIPRQPAGSPYAENAVPAGGDLDRFGVAIDEQEPCGSHVEIERSLQRLDAPDNGALISSVAVEREPESDSSSALTESDSTNAAPAFADPSAVSAKGRDHPPVMVSPQSNSRFKRRF